MSWKDISKSSYSLSIEKYGEWAPSHPFALRYQGNRVQYSEGDEISSANDYRFNVDFTGVPLGPSHFPCAYWHRNYIPPIETVFTSLTYPLEVVDRCTCNCILMSGEFRRILLSYSIPYESVNSTINLTGGDFRSIVTSYTYWPSESLTSTGIILTGGEFKLVVYTYTYWPAESLGNCVISLNGGEFKDVLIDYTYWPSEALTPAISLTGGSHATA